MGDIIKLNNFEDIYNKTYKRILRYVICKCNNLDDVNELVQDVYIEFYHILEKKPFIKIEDETSYIIGISKNILKKYYRGKYKEKANIIYFSKDIEENEPEIADNVNLEENIINEENVRKIWDYLNEKNALIAKIFYLYYVSDLSINEISSELEINESTTKNYIYRTLKELKKFFGEEGNLNEK